MTARFAFADFLLDPADRRLRRDGAPVELNGRYLDALALLVREQGTLVSKDRFLDEVWDGVPVTDEALTQCIKTLRRQLGDDASNPRFIQTVPKHGYRFIAPVELLDGEDKPRGSRPRGIATRGPASDDGDCGHVGRWSGWGRRRPHLWLCRRVAAGPQGVGALSVLLVLLGVTTLVALIGGAGVSIGIAAVGLLNSRSATWIIAGGMAGGLLVGALAKMFGLDAFTLLVGHSPQNITGPAKARYLAGPSALAPGLAPVPGRLATPPPERVSSVQSQEC